MSSIRPAASEVDETLTDFEIVGLELACNLADGHAYHDISETMVGVADRLDVIWRNCDSTPVPAAERSFVEAFAILSGSPSISAAVGYKIAPTASNSIDIVAALLAGKRMRTSLVEPTFDNIALMMRRRGVSLRPLRETDILAAVEAQNLEDLVSRSSCDALFIVDPNNPTGTTLDAIQIGTIAAHCAAQDILLIIDKSFRFYGSHAFDLYRLLDESGASFILIEDTGKVWPTHDLKASLVLASPDIYPEFEAIYNELYLCHSRLALGLLEMCMRETHRLGLDQVVAAQVRKRRRTLRDGLAGSGLVVEPVAHDSLLPVEWMNCRAVGRRDLELTRLLQSQGISVLPGRNFYWASGTADENQWNIRLAMMKPLVSFERSIEQLAWACRAMQVV